jgi:hypothetical protein
MSDVVSYARSDYTHAKIQWQTNRAACKGERAVKALPDALPYINAHDATPANAQRNLAYRKRAVWFNASGRTLEGLVGLAFRKDPTINVGPMTYLQDDADGNAVSIYNLSQLALTDVLQTGRHGLLVDMVNDRPSIIGYSPESIINWRTTTVNSHRRLTLLILEEIVEKELEYACEVSVQWRVYRLTDNKVTVQLFKQSDDGKSILDPENITVSKPDAVNPSLTEIPFFFIGSKTNSANIDDAPLQALIDINYAHFRDSADYQDSVFYVGQAQPWISGLTEEWRDFLIAQGIYVGSRAPIILPEGGQFGISQAQPNTLAHEAMIDKEKQMVSLGARLVEMGTITKTATQAAGDISSSNSVLSLCCSNVSEAFIRAIQTCGLFLNGKPYKEADYRITQDYVDIAADAGMIAALVKSWQSSAFAKTDLYAYLRKVGIIEQERTDEMIDADIEANPPLLEDTGMNGDINPENTGVAG